MGILRLLLALSVVAMHYGPIFGQKLVGGQIAVQSFYIISGFYMSLILNEKYVGVNGSYSLFISNRFYRLYPVYWVVLAVTIVFMAISGLITHGEKMYVFKSYLTLVPNGAAYIFLVFSNLMMFGQDLVMFMGLNPDSGNLFFTSDFALTDPQLHTYLFVPQAWTLGIELMFYLIAPFVVRKGYGIVLILMALSIVIRLTTYYVFGFTNDPWTYRFFPSELLLFLSGYLSYKGYVHIRRKSIPSWVFILILIIVLSLTVLYQYVDSQSLVNFPFSVKQMAYLICIFLSIPFLFEYFKNSRIDSLIGELSYPVYISHILVGIVCWSQPIMFLKTGWGIAAATIVFSLVLNKFVSDPVERFRQSRLKRIGAKTKTAGEPAVETVS